MYPENFTMADAERFAKNGCVTETFRLAVKSDCGKCMVVTALSRYEGEAAPTIRFYLIREGEEEKTLYASHSYVIGHKEERTRQQWRVPPMFHPALRAEIEVTVPEGTKLFLTDFQNAYSDPQRANEVGLRFNAHLGFSSLAPANTRPAVELAAQCGFLACIVNPKEIADGEIICQHDPYLPKYARYADGRVADDERKIYEMTFPEMDRWDYGLRMDEIFRGTRLLRLEDFFALCAETGMKPMFSVHRYALQLTGWRKIETMIRKFGLTKALNVKASRVDTLETAYSVLGDSIEGYTLYRPWLEELRDSALKDAKNRVVLESYWKTETTEELVKKSLDCGFGAAVYGLPNGEMEAYRKYVDWGVTEFTEDYHCSMGLNW